MVPGNRWEQVGHNLCVSSGGFSVKFQAKDPGRSLCLENRSLAMLQGKPMAKLSSSKTRYMHPEALSRLLHGEVCPLCRGWLWLRFLPQLCGCVWLPTRSH